MANFQVNNTDAEGRLCLADALIYTCKLGVDKVIYIKLVFEIFVEPLQIVLEIGSNVILNCFADH